MKVTDWLRAGLDPAFGTVEHWITDQLGRLGAEEEAAYALTVGARNVRILLATDAGLLDCLWDGPDEGAQRRLTSTMSLWGEVSGLRIVSRTTIDASLRRPDPVWSLTLREPSVDIHDAVDEGAVLEFWKACRSDIERSR